MNYLELQKLKEKNEAVIIQTAYEGTCQLWLVNNTGEFQYYEVLTDNSCNITNLIEWTELIK